MLNAQCDAENTKCYVVMAALLQPKLKFQSAAAFHSRTKRLKPILKQLILKTSRELKIKSIDRHSCGTIPVISVKTPEPCTAMFTDTNNLHILLSFYVLACATIKKP
jgi:hypothetical protein